MPDSRARPGRTESLELPGVGLVIPGVQAEPFAIQAVQPSPCTQACPAGINVKSYVSLIAEEKFAEALEVVRERCPLPGVCGRICHHPCEDVCRRADVDEAVAIRSLKRFVSDLALELPPPAPPEVVETGEHVAIIGSGPAGLTAAWDLRRAGYRIKVFESEPQPGGMLRYGIADYRLPTDVLEAEIGALVAAGIEIETGCRIGSDRQLEDLLGNGYAAVLFAVGAQLGRRLGLEGEADCPQVEDALGFLRRVNSGERSPVAGRVLVIGGGSTAIEAARAALRLGADTVEIVYRRHRGEMPADDEEVELATEEGIGLRLLTAPERLLRKEGKLTGLECLQVALGEPDASGRRRPVPIPGSEFIVPADLILAAIGQNTDLDFLPPDVVDRVTDRGLLTVDSRTVMTRMQGVFAAGDVVSGPATVIDAIAAGHRAAAAILDFLEEDRPPATVEDAATDRPEWEIPSPPPPTARRLRPAHSPIAAGSEFAEVEAALSHADAVSEARRCMRCGPCSECLICASSCGRRHLSVRFSGEAGEPAVLLRAPARVASALESHGDGRIPASAWLQTDSGSSRISAASSPALEIFPTRITIDEEYCRGCARCLEVCSFDAISLVDPDAPETTVRVSAALCRGCNLCAAVCPTDAAVPATVAPGWWGTRIEDLYPALTAHASSERIVALACQRRIAAVETALAESDLGDRPVHVVPIRCAGQLEAGALLELYRNGADRILLAGCLTGSCRYGYGPQLAAEQVLRTQTALAELGLEPRVLSTDWAAGDREPPADLERLVMPPPGRRSSIIDEAPGGADR